MGQPLSNEAVMYVDYDGIANDLSLAHVLDVEAILVRLLEKARKRFQLQKSVVFGDWLSIKQQEELERRGFVCHRIPAGSSASREISSRIGQILSDKSSIEYFVLVVPPSGYAQSLLNLREAGKTVILWAPSQISWAERRLCAEWESIVRLGQWRKDRWPRQVMLDAVVLIADHLSSDKGNVFLLEELLGRMRDLAVLATAAETWLNIAVREQTIWIEHSANPLSSPYGQINYRHPIVQRALLTRELILSVVIAMIADRDWVAFSSVERAIQSVKSLSGSQALRHAWLELLVAEGELVAAKIPALGGTYQTTTLKPNPVHFAVVQQSRRQDFNLANLIIIANNFMFRRGYKWMSASVLLRILTKSTSRITARAILRAAGEHGIISFGTEKSRENPKFVVTTVGLTQGHPLVQKALHQFNAVIRAVDSLVTKRDLGISYSLLVEELVSSKVVLDDEEATFWVRLLQSERILSEARFVLGPKEVISIFRPRLGDPLVAQALASKVQEVQEV